jgi:hypothetical protein
MEDQLAAVTSYDDLRHNSFLRSGFSVEKSSFSKTDDCTRMDVASSSKGKNLTSFGANTLNRVLIFICSKLIFNYANVE